MTGYERMIARARWERPLGHDLVSPEVYLLWAIQPPRWWYGERIETLVAELGERATIHLLRP